MSAAPPVIHWFRRDLRVDDNTALCAASASGSPVVPVYIRSDWKHSHPWTGPKRQEFLSGCLKELSTSLEKLKGVLLIRKGDQVQALRKLVEETGATAIYTNRDPDPFGMQMETEVADLCRDLGVEFHAHEDVCLHDRDAVLKKDGEPYRVFTPYSKVWLKADKEEPVGTPNNLNSPTDFASEPLPSLETWGLKKDWDHILEPGENAGHKRLEEALSSVVDTYDKTRNTPSIRGVSRLSQDLRWGTLSIRRIYAEVMKRRESANSSATESIDVFIKELAWREFYMQVLYQSPNVLELEYSPQWRGLEWDEPGEQFEAWKEGRTGFPIVDAGQRQLVKHGFMHNRVRMISAMFLTKDLHIDWRLGEQFFAQHLVDGEIGSNNGGWQWSAGTGADAAPYFRVQNPWTQTKRFDPKGEYIKQWVPELKDVTAKKFFSAPEKGSIAPGYPSPIVDHSDERDRTLEIFKKHRAKQQ